jgi:Ca2+-binding EF-hand superfamily protein
MATRKKTFNKKRPQRATSNVFAMFDQNQIQEFKEAFNLIDQDRDGFITKEDLQDMFVSLGKPSNEKEILEMLNDGAAGSTEPTSSVNFTMFLTLFGVKMTGTDSEDVIRNAFSIFDDHGTGLIPEDKFRELITTIGDRYTNEEVKFFDNLHIRIKNLFILRLMNYFEELIAKKME